MIVLLVIAVPLFLYSLKSMGVWGHSSVTPAQAAGAARTAEKKSGSLQARVNSNLDPTLRLDRLQASQKIQYAGGTRNIFRMEEPRPIPLPTPIATVNPTPTPYVPPPPPPINLKFYGFSSKPGEPKRVFLAEGDDIFVAKEGDVINRKYKIVQITNNSVLVEDLLNNNRQTIPLTAPTTG